MQTSVEARTKIADQARRELVWALVRFAWQPACFADAVTALALLAEAENETFGNNATGEFLGRYQVYLGGTAVPYVERLPVLDDLVNEGRTSLTRLVVRALAQAGEEHASRMDGEPASDAVPER